MFEGLWKWLLRSVKGGAPGPRTRVRGADPRPALAGEAPGLWASNHLAEASRLEGWQFVAVRTLARMCSEADPIFLSVVSSLFIAIRAAFIAVRSPSFVASLKASTMARSIETMR